MSVKPIYTEIEIHKSGEMPTTINGRSTKNLEKLPPGKYWSRNAFEGIFLMNKRTYDIVLNLTDAQLSTL